MDGTIKYCIVKRNRNIFLHKDPTNTHLLFIPVDPKKYMYLALVGKMDEEEDIYIAQLLVRFPEEVFEDTINEEIEYFGKRFIEVETLKCKSSNPSPGKYIINPSKKGVNILSNLEINYALEYSTVGRRMYTIKGDLNLVTGDVTQKDMNMVAAKQVAFMGGKQRFEEMLKINNSKKIISEFDPVITPTMVGFGVAGLGIALLRGAIANEILDNLDRRDNISIKMCKRLAGIGGFEKEISKEEMNKYIKCRLSSLKTTLRTLKTAREQCNRAKNQKQCVTTANRGIEVVARQILKLELKLNKKSLFTPHN